MVAGATQNKLEQPPLEQRYYALARWRPLATLAIAGFRWLSSGYLASTFSSPAAATMLYYTSDRPCPEVLRLFKRGGRWRWLTVDHIKMVG